MRALIDRPRFEVRIWNRRKAVLVENCLDGVAIQTASRSISPREKASLVRYLAAEGFIDDRYRWFSESEFGTNSNVTWLVDDPRVAKVPVLRARALRKIIYLICFATALWLGLMAFAFLHVSS